MSSSVNTINTATGATVPVSANKSALGKDDFLKLMIAQMKNQDPMNPMDGTQYSAQLAQFSSLEQLTNLNSTMTASMNANATLTQSINNTMMATLIGKDVKLSGNDIQVAGQSNVTFGYTLPQTASAVSINIYNSQGAIVKTITGAPTNTGEDKLSWDLSDNNGNKLQNGSYTYGITALDMNGKELTIDSYKEGNISGVKFSTNGSTVLIDGAEYQLSSIIEVLNPSTGGK